MGDPDSDAVVRLQQALVDVTAITGKSYDLGKSGPKHNGVDGMYGSKTAAAVRKFKSDENLGYAQYGDVGPGTMHRLDQLFSPGAAHPKPKPGPTAAPTFKIVGPVKATATPIEHPWTPQTYAFGFTDGTFQIDAHVSATALKTADFDDWQIGIVQQVAGPMLRFCFQPMNRPPRPGLNEVFVEDVVLPSFLMPDREPASPIWMRWSSYRDLAHQSPGTLFVSFPVNSHDRPHYSGKTHLGASHSDPKSQFKFISRSTHFGLFQTFVIARRISTNQAIPLHLVEWVMYSAVDWISQLYFGTSGTVESSPSPEFKIITNRPASSGDVLAPLGGPDINHAKRSGTWQPRCPPF